MAKKLDIAMARPDPRGFKQPGEPFLQAGFAVAMACAVDLDCAASADPKLANSDTFGQGWMARVKPAMPPRQVQC